MRDIQERRKGEQGIFKRAKRTGNKLPIARECTMARAGCVSWLSVAGHGMHDIPRFTPLRGLSVSIYGAGAGEDSPDIGREIHKEQALLCNPDVAEEDAVACRLEEVLPRGQHRQRARVQQDELGPVRGGGRAAVLQDEPRGRLRGVADGGPCGCDVWMGEIDRHGGRCDGVRSGGDGKEEVIK